MVDATVHPTSEFGFFICSTTIPQAVSKLNHKKQHREIGKNTVVGALSLTPAVLPISEIAGQVGDLRFAQNTLYFCTSGDGSSVASTVWKDVLYSVPVPAITALPDGESGEFVVRDPGNGTLYYTDGVDATAP